MALPPADPAPATTRSKEDFVNIERERKQSFKFPSAFVVDDMPTEEPLGLEGCE
jgi:hypothetical protein